MIRSIFALSFKNNLIKWWNEKKVSLQDEYDKKESELVAEYEKNKFCLENRLKESNERIQLKIEECARQEKEIEFLNQRNNDRKFELERVNEELKTQIRLIEAKASPHHVWENAVSLGFSKAWDMMIPLMTNGLDKVKEKIKELEIEESLPRINTIVEQRIKNMGDQALIQVYDLQKKKQEFELKLSQAVNPQDKNRFANYIRLLDWILGTRSEES